MEILPGEKFHQYRHLPSLAKNLFLSLNFVNDCIEDMANFTALAKILSTKNFCNTKVAGLGKTSDDHYLMHYDNLIAKFRAGMHGTTT